MDNDSELPELSAEQLEYVILRQSGKNKSDAYRIAYKAEGKPNNQVWVRSSEVESGSAVSVWIEHIKLGKITAGITELEYTKERYLKDLADCGEACRKAGAWSTYFKSIEATGKSCGHVVNAVEISHTNKADTDLLEQLEKLLGPEASQEAARRMGYQVDTSIDRDLH